MNNDLYNSFYLELKEVSQKYKDSIGLEDLNHLRKFEIIGISMTIFGYVSGAFYLNPISAYLIAIGHFTSWMIGHYVLHGAYDKIPNVPLRFTSRGFAKGWRRYYDWIDWIFPEAWKYEHNTLHHSHTSEKYDPDNVERLFKTIRDLKVPIVFKYVITILISLTWKWSYYAPSTLMHLQKKQGKDKSTNFNFYKLYNPFTKNGFEFWKLCLIPYISFRFVFIPLCFLPFGYHIFINAFYISILADLFSNFHGFLMIGPNHTGNDLYKFSYTPKSKPMRVIHQIYCTTNYSSRGLFQDVFHGYVNYHIEHHIWPSLTVLKYKNMAVEIENICLKFSIPYVNQPVYTRFAKLFSICVGKSTIPVFEKYEN